ncbi:hypothetical protein [Flavobacterium sp. GNP002]
MADISIIFNGAKNTGTENLELEVFANTMNNITVSLKNKDHFSEYPEIIQLSKSTAIKLHRELKKQISFLESEVDNG